MTNELKGKVNYSVNGNIAILEVDNPPVNPLSSGVRAGLAEFIEKANSDDSVQGNYPYRCWKIFHCWS